jgi:tetratricopeptide (TPR) repeat protein
VTRRLLALLVLIAAGCGPHRPAGLQPVSLPELSKMAPSAQTQIREAFKSLTRQIETSRTTIADLANAYGEFGKLLMAADERDRAKPCFLNAQTLAPGDFRWPYYLGHLHRKNGDLPAASASFERALQLKPDDVATLVWLGNVQLDEGHPADATLQFEKALSLQPNARSAVFGLGRVALAEQRYSEAIEKLETVLREDPRAGAVHYPLAMAYRAIGNTRQAETHVRLREDRPVLPADPLIVELETLLESPQTYESRGIQALNNKDWPQAAALFRKGLELAPDHAALRHRLATALYMMGDVAGAQDQFEQVVRNAPGFHLAQYSLGLLLQAQGRHAEAIEHLSAALETQANYTEARLRLANSLRRVGRAAEALPHYDRVLAEAPDHSEARFNRAITFAQVHRYRDARNALADAMKMHPDQPLFAHGLARLLASAPDNSVRDGAQAIALVQRLLQKEQRTLELGETLAMALAAAGRFEEAAAVQRDLLKGAERNALTGVVPRLAGNLARYEHREPCRTPWTAAEVP